MVTADLEELRGVRQEALLRLRPELALESLEEAEAFVHGRGVVLVLPLEHDLARDNGTEAFEGRARGSQRLRRGGRAPP